MAAVRSALARLSGRSCVSCGSSAAAPMGLGGGVLGIARVVRPAAAVTTPPLRPAAVVGNLESLQRFSTKSREWAGPHTSGSVLHKLGQWSKDCIKNVRKADSAKTLFVCSTIVSVASVSFMMANIWSLKKASKY